MNPIQKQKDLIKDLIVAALESAKAEDLINYEKVPEFQIEKPKEESHGDFACNIAMLLAKQARMAPRKIAELIVQKFKVEAMPIIENIEVAGSGFINFHFKIDWLYEIPAVVLKMGADYGRNEDKHKKIQVEFVSANPTGNLHMGNARGGAIGDTLANILGRAGYQVEREFYINDAGNQMDKYAESLEARYLQLLDQIVTFPEDGYAGQDVLDTVKNIISEYKEQLLDIPSSERKKILLEYALKEKLIFIRATLGRFGINYDHWFSEKTLHETGKVNEAINLLKEKGLAYEAEDALWFKSTAFGDEKDEVLIRANSMPTYFASDIAYHMDKFNRGFDRVINIWGADHHGHVSRMKGAVAALGVDPERLEILLMQLVRLYRTGEIVRMSKRTGTTVSLDELIDEVGVDAARFFFVMRNPDSHLDFDLVLAKKESQDNPVYYVQYAHARISSIFKQAEQVNVKMNKVEDINVSLLIEKEELALLKKIAEFPEEIAVSARNMAPHRIARYVLELAALFHSFYNNHRVIIENEELLQARLLLMDTCRICIKNSLDILGVSAPEKM